MFISVFDVFKVSVGPSSSHTMGPMRAARDFRDRAAMLDAAATEGARLVCILLGSLAYTGVGHRTHSAVLIGWGGIRPATFDRSEAGVLLDRIAGERSISLDDGRRISVDPESAVIEDRTRKPLFHANEMQMRLVSPNDEVLLEQTYCSIGGGFVLTADEMVSRDTLLEEFDAVPYGFKSSEQMLDMARESQLSIAGMKRENERAFAPDRDVDAGLNEVWEVMNACIERGLAGDGILPGGLNVRRRAKAVASNLAAKAGANQQPLHSAMDWLAAYAMAVNEENAAGGQVVTAPTNGAAGVIPATIRYYLEHVPGASTSHIPDMLLTAAAIGGLIKFNASISGAEVGCQGEVGSAAAMAAGAICAAMGGTPAQVENAAEIALEHHLGMTCDPVKGLVQVPCIERNGMGAVKAVAAASLALAGDGTHLVSLDACIETMRVTGRDMDSNYKETSLGGLSVSVPGC
ncbi:MAG: L-serine ammonia-lyase [Hyphomicrobiaceae bacterium]|nr:L-serine ammonia-lyase [Hyphomicrobiaceae bacterium]MCC0024225.1 L-serine ammonia-lyase [Hyphomicrobiaceae bacterium]